MKLVLRNRYDEFNQQRCKLAQLMELKRTQLNKILDQFSFWIPNRENYTSLKKWQQSIVPWIPDNEADICINCGTRFENIFQRKHHCRLCGQVLCNNSNCFLFIPIKSGIELSKSEKVWTSDLLVCRKCHSLLFVEFYPLKENEENILERNYRRVHELQTQALELINQHNSKIDQFRSCEIQIQDNNNNYINLINDIESCSRTLTEIFSSILYQIKEIKESNLIKDNSLSCYPIRNLDLAKFQINQLQYAIYRCIKRFVNRLKFIIFWKHRSFIDSYQKRIKLFDDDDAFNSKLDFSSFFQKVSSVLLLNNFSLSTQDKTNVSQHNSSNITDCTQQKKISIDELKNYLETLLEQKAILQINLELTANEEDKMYILLSISDIEEEIRRIQEKAALMFQKK